MKKFTLILASLVMVFSLAACGNREGKNAAGADDGGKTDAAVTAAPAEIEQSIADAVGADNYLCDTEIDKDWLQNHFGLDTDKIEAYVAKQNSISSVNPDTVIILKVRDDYADEAVDRLNEEFAQMVSYVRQYPFGTAKVLNARLYQSGSYVMYIVAGASYEGEDAEEENKLAADEYAKIDEAVEGIFGTLPENLAVAPEV